jgi:hypothetical protein
MPLDELFFLQIKLIIHFISQKYFIIRMIKLINTTSKTYQDRIEIRKILTNFVCVCNILVCRSLSKDVLEESHPMAFPLIFVFLTSTRNLVCGSKGILLALKKDYWVV